MPIGRPHRESSAAPCFRAFVRIIDARTEVRGHAARGTQQYTAAYLDSYMCDARHRGERKASSGVESRAPSLDWCSAQLRDVTDRRKGRRLRSPSLQGDPKGGMGTQGLSPAPSRPPSADGGTRTSRTVNNQPWSWRLTRAGGTACSHGAVSARLSAVSPQLHLGVRVSCVGYPAPLSSAPRLPRSESRIQDAVA